MRLSVFSATVLAAAIASVSVPPAALAHTHVHHMSIADNASLTAPPANFKVEFEAKAGLTSVKLTDAAGKAVPLAYKPPADQALAFTIPLPTLTKGAYVLTWTSVGQDGHVMPGTVHFTITG